MTLLSPGIEIKEKDLSAYISRAATGRAATVGKFQWGPCFEIVQVTDESDLVTNFGLPDDYTYGSFLSCLNFLKYGNDLRLVRICDDRAVDDGGTSRNASAEFSVSFNIDNSGADYVVGDKVYAEYTNIAWTRVGTVATLQFPHHCLTTGETIAITASSEIAAIIVSDAVPVTVLSLDTISIPCSDAGATSGTVSLYVEADHIGLVATLGGTDDITGITVVQAGVNEIVTSGRWGGPNSEMNFVVDITSSGSGADLGLSVSKDSTIYFPNDSKSDEAMLDHAATMAALNLPTVYGRFPGAFGNDIQVDLINYEDFSGTTTTIPIAIPEGVYQPTRANINRSVFGVNGPQTGDQWGIIVYYKGEIVETFVGSTKVGDKDIYGRSIYISDLFAGGVSNYIMAACGAEGNWIQHSVRLTLDGGTDTGAQTGDWLQGWDLFSDPDTLYVNLLFSGGACNESEADSLIIQQYMIQSVAEVRRDCLAFVSPSIDTTTRKPVATAVADAVQYRTDLAVNTSFAEGDTGQHKLMFDKYNDRKRWIAMNADIAGLCAFTDRVANTWASPGGLNRGVIKGVIKLAYDAKRSYRDTLYEAQLNPIVQFPAEGYCLWGDKTLQGKPSAFDRINVRRLFNMLEKAIGDASKYKLFENNTAFTRNAFVTEVSSYLDIIKGQGGVVDYYVWCDERNNTPAVIDRNEFVGTIFVKPPRSINYITLNFVATSSGANFEELISQQF